MFLLFPCTWVESLPFDKLSNVCAFCTSFHSVANIISFPSAAKEWRFWRELISTNSGKISPAFVGAFAAQPHFGEVFARGLFFTVINREKWEQGAMFRCKPGQIWRDISLQGSTCSSSAENFKRLPPLKLQSLISLLTWRAPFQVIVSILLYFSYCSNYSFLITRVVQWCDQLRGYLCKLSWGLKKNTCPCRGHQGQGGVGDFTNPILLNKPIFISTSAHWGFANWETLGIWV